MKHDNSNPLTLLITEEKGGTEFKGSLMKSVNRIAYNNSADFDEVLTWFEEKRAEYKQAEQFVSVIIQTRHIKVNELPATYIDSNTNEVKTMDETIGVKVGNTYKTTSLVSVNSVTIITSTGLEIILPAEVVSPALSTVGEAEQPTSLEVEEIYAATPLLDNEKSGMPEISVVEERSNEKYYIYPFQDSQWNQVEVTNDFDGLPGFMQYFFLKWAYYMASLSDLTGSKSAYHPSRADILALADCALKKLPLQPIGNFLTSEYLNTVGAHMVADRAQTISNFIQKIQAARKGKHSGGEEIIKALSVTINNFSPETIYRSKRGANACYPLSRDGKNIVIERPITVDMSDYTRTGNNNSFDVFTMKPGTANFKNL